MSSLWKKQTDNELRTRIFAALGRNVNYQEQTVFGVPASQLDEKVFYRDATFLKDAPYLSTLMENPNHIGCHTLGHSEPFFAGTQEIERELVDICATDILQGQPGEHDGYVASGGTEANLQAIWVYRNHFRTRGAALDEICILCSSDSHYCVDKAANILGIGIAKVAVDERTRGANAQEIAAVIDGMLAKGKKHFIVVLNMMTTMFGSVDKIDDWTGVLNARSIDFRIHVDAAFGGFYYPFTEHADALNFSHPDVSSVTLDAHKMLQAPYGTGLFLIRKGLLQHVLTETASYVEGQDYTLIGSRSGANAISVWMILMRYGPHGWREKIFVLQKRTQWLCDQLDGAGVAYYRHPNANIVTLKASAISAELAAQYWLVPDDRHNPRWFKIVVMDHVTIDKLEPFIGAMQGE